MVNRHESALAAYRADLERELVDREKHWDSWDTITREASMMVEKRDRDMISRYESTTGA